MDNNQSPITNNQQINSFFSVSWFGYSSILGYCDLVIGYLTRGRLKNGQLTFVR